MIDSESHWQFTVRCLQQSGFSVCGQQHERTRAGYGTFGTGEECGAES